MYGGGTPYAASSVSEAMGDTPPTCGGMAVARFQGRRVAEVAAATRVTAAA